LKIAIIGATGAVGREMIEDLENSSVKDISLTLFASPKSAGQGLQFRGKSHTVQAFKMDDFKGYQVALMSAGSGFSKEFARSIARTGCYVIDNSSAWRMEPDCPLIVPEVNGHELKKAAPSKIIANPNCSTIQMVVALKPLHDKYGMEMSSAKVTAVKKKKWCAKHVAS
jgi:aspartate-semialdehyde dehydrogenase